MKIKVDYPNRPKDSDVDITNLGTFKNGSTTNIDDARWERFLAADPDAAKVVGDQKTQVTFPYDVPELETEEADTSGTEATPTDDTGSSDTNKNKES